MRTIRILFSFLMLSFLAGRLTAADTKGTLLELLKEAERYDESVWHQAAHPNAPADGGYFGSGVSDGNGGTRSNCAVALAYAVLVRAYPDDPRRALRLGRIRQALNYAANTHLSAAADRVCVDGKRWGHDWQTALWAGTMGFVCAQMEKDLPAGTIADCRRALADEATYRAGIAPESGFEKDTKAEENGWNSNVLALAASWLPGHASARLWLDSAKKYLVNTSTVANTAGDPLASWVTTVTMFPSFAVENHGFYHPAYQTDSGNTVADSLTIARIVNPAVATDLKPFAEHNVMNVWRHLSHMLVDSGDFAFPSGMDWALHNYEQVSYFAWLATHFNDPLARWADQQTTQLLRHRQIVSGDGRILGESEANAFYMEAHLQRTIAMAWLHHAYADHPDGPVALPLDFVEHYSDIKLIAQRGPAGFFSISYGRKITGVIIPPTEAMPDKAFVTTPRVPGMIGLGALGIPTAARLIRFTPNASGFEAALTVQHGENGSTDVYVKSTGDTVAIVEVPRAILNGASSANGSFSIGIENHALTGGSRLLAWKDGASVIVAKSGLTVDVPDSWVCVSERLGMIAGPAGQFRYQAANRYNRRGAAEDTLEFLPRIPQSLRYAVFVPGGSSKDTAAIAESVRWQINGDSGVLTYSDRKRGPQELAVKLRP